MPKCTICGKKFDTLAALRDHHRSVHPKSRFVTEGSRLSRNLIVGVVIVLVVVGSLVGYVIYTSQTSGSSSSQTGLLNTDISPALSQNISGVSLQTLEAIGTNQGTKAPTSISGSNLTSGGLPEVLYIGAEYCQYCAAERWALAVALSQFGTLSGIEYMQSASDEGNYATLTFVNVSYTSKYITFVPIEHADRNGDPLQPVTTAEQTLWYDYTYQNDESYPFVDIGGQYVVGSGSQYTFPSGFNENWTQIASQLNNPSNSLTKLIDGSANQLIAAICKVDGGNPTSLCSQSMYQTVSFSISGLTATGQQSNLMLTEMWSAGTSKR